MKFLKNIGPGIVVAATGVGAGAKYGTVIIWAAIVGAVIKFVLNEGIARWQLATGTTVLQGWRHQFHALVSIYFMVYLFLWGFIVAGALIAACGLAAHAIFPFFSVEVWGIVHSLMALLLVYVGRYQLIESLMKFFIGLMFNKNFTISETKIDVRSRNYLFFLFYLAIPPLVLLFFGKPVWVVVIYSIIGAFFMPFLAVLLLIMNNKIKWVKDFKNNLIINLLLFAGLVLFVVLCIKEIWLRLF
jgi:Mn2+/Fe2+ NRAMP family transporter